MPFLQVARLLDGLLYEVMTWLIFYPVTLWRSVRHPLRTMEYARREMARNEAEQFTETLRPPIFLLVTVILAYVVELAAVGESALVSNQIGAANLINDDQSVMILRIVAYALFPVVMAAIETALERKPIDRDTLQEPFYAQCFLAAPFVLALCLAGTAIRRPEPWLEPAGALFALAATILYVGTEARGWCARPAGDGAAPSPSRLAATSAAWPSSACWPGCSAAIEVDAEKIAMIVGDGRVSGLLLRPLDARALYVFAHGAGVGMTHQAMESNAQGLAARGIATLRYQFPYMEKGSHRPDPPRIAHAAVRAAAAEAVRLAPELPLFAGGRSYGGRMTSQAQAIDPLPGVRGLSFLGFPLHPAGRPGVDRAGHLAEVQVPMLFVSGDRDALAKMDLLRPVVASLGGRATLHLVGGADHSFKVPASSGRKSSDAEAEALDALAGWIQERTA